MKLRKTVKLGRCHHWGECGYMQQELRLVLHRKKARVGAPVSRGWFCIGHTNKYLDVHQKRLDKGFTESVFPVIKTRALDSVKII